ncbi:polyprenyl synthetase family protein [Pelotomaculum propionicicum]|uniref:Octaprenyl diphosphate synthase n=1 Tax=Pelotomaculum propionicicum TaxID=258475 RepID=A0A4Y7RPL7_9FIRM|nr:polyprenyl synthetase family protein [Pelotomaculum propionicicum]TEB10736.1 Octaprenyl diphosphate synthase [Pelotomaculum propionicicum]
MLSSIIQPIEKEITAVNNQIEKHLLIKSGNLKSFAHLEFPPLNKSIRPALLILTARLFGCNPEKAVPMGCVIQFIYMASKVHAAISEKDSDYIRGNTDPRDGSQFPVLVGDYLYGKFFYFLCRDGQLNFLGTLSELVCTIHEGGILSKKSEGQDPREIIRKETAELFAVSCWLGASLAGATEREQESMRRFGLNFGMAYGLLEQGGPAGYVTSYCKEALAHLAGIPARADKSVFEQIVQKLSGSGLAATRMVI